MPSSWDALFVLVVLLPGFLCGRIVDTMFVRPERSEFSRATESLLYSFIIYTGFALTFPSKLQEIRPVHLGVLALYSLVLGVSIGTALHKDFPTAFLRRLGFTQRTTSDSVWHETFQNYGGYVQVQLKDGRQVMGWLKFYSDREERMSMFLEDAAWLNSESRVFPINGPGILLSHDSGIETVMFLNPEIGTEKAVGQPA